MKARDVLTLGMLWVVAAAVAVVTYLAIFVALVSLLPRRAEGQWKTRDVVLATTAVTFAALDFSTTMDAVRRCRPYGSELECHVGGPDGRECVEQNPLIGCFPSPWKLRAFTSLGIASELYVGSRLRGWYRTAWFAGWTAVSLSLVRYNVSHGFRVTVRL